MLALLEIHWPNIVHIYVYNGPIFIVCREVQPFQTTYLILALNEAELTSQQKMHRGYILKIKF